MSTTIVTALATAPETGTDDLFDLDISVIESGPVIPELLRSTSDNCGGTCASACTSCKS
ncbi:FxLD family lanthipeptide [Rhizomonospora bruguierae]|uniref:FxLD family lanthipeptide n=1 Tax=Rhizomonospora bruguierae TaxID=1581705 RepID=UPI001BCA9CBE|nr:FxLD family lanthipeptide [Micromonospora sp. NBRC 107566]